MTDATRQEYGGNSPVAMRFVSLFLGALLLNVFAFLMIKARPGIYKVKEYRPMLLNIKLSVLPLVILTVNIIIFVILTMVAGYTGIRPFWVSAYVLFFAGLLVWLLFLPNSGYLITELNLNHRVADVNEVPIWYDIVSVLALALSGIVNMLLNIVIIQTSFLVVFDPDMLRTSDYTLLFLSGFGIIFLMVIGIYFGRAIRVNSWDVLHPRRFFAKLLKHFSAPGVCKDFAFYVCFNTAFFVIMYVAFGIPFYFM